MTAGLLLCSAAAAQAATYTVTSYADSGPGTLRDAITKSNAQPRPGGNTIEVPAIGQAPHTIKLDSLLPAIVGPATIIGVQKGQAVLSRPSVAIDGSNFIDGDDTASCGAGSPNIRELNGAAFQVVDSGNVRISNLEVRSFCIGILSLRSHDNRFDHNIIHNTSGGAGIMITGDAGDAGGSSTAGLSINNLVEMNTVYDTGDGFECTRGTTNTTYRGNTLFETGHHGNVPPSQGIECAGSGNDRIYIVGNSFTGYSDGLQMNSMTNGVIAGNTITRTTYGITWGGSGTVIGNTITGNRMGVGPTGSAAVTITQNRIFNNGHANIISQAGAAGGTTDPGSPALLGIDYGTDGVTPNDVSGCADGLPDCTAPQNFPVLSSTSAWNADGTLSFAATLQSRPNGVYRVEFYGNHALNPAGYGEGEASVGSVVVTTDASGNAAVTYKSGVNPLGDATRSAYFTATATNLATGATSEFGAALRLSH
jgi:3-dehydroshikimate dehydratase